MNEPLWLSRLLVDAFHLDLLRLHGGLPGTRDENGLEAALARPRHKFFYQPDCDLADLAAAYGYGIATGHPYSDGNKRAALMAAYTFLAMNHWELDADEREAVFTIEALAAGKLSESDLAAWIRRHLVPLVEGP